MSKRFMFMGSLEEEISSDDEEKLFDIITDAVEKAGFEFTTYTSHILTSDMSMHNLKLQIDHFVPEDELYKKG